MKTEYDFSKGKRNSYTKRLKKAATIRLEPDIIESQEGYIPRSLLRQKQT